MNVPNFASFVALALSCTLAAGQSDPSHGALATPNELLLKDYRPRSIFKVNETRIEKARHPLIDMHTHVRVNTREEVTRWIHTLDSVGVEKAVVLVGATGEAFDEAAQLLREHADRFELWCGLDFHGHSQPMFSDRIVAELERCHRLGARGVGELIDKGRGLSILRRQAGKVSEYPEMGSAEGLHLDDPRLDGVLEKCADLGMPVNIHVAEPRWMYEAMDASNDGLMPALRWKVSKDPGVVQFDEMIATLDRAAVKHPRTTFIACHFANTGHDLAILGGMLDKHANLYADTGARFGEIAAIPRHSAEFFVKYQDRLLYGTDLTQTADMYRGTFRVFESLDEHFYHRTISGYQWPLHGLGLSDGVLRKIYSENARKVLARGPANAAPKAD